MNDEQTKSEEFRRFDKAMDKVLSVKPEELKKRLAAAKQAKTGKRYPKGRKIPATG